MAPPFPRNLAAALQRAPVFSRRVEHGQVRVDLLVHCIVHHIVHYIVHYTVHYTVHCMVHYTSFSQPRADLAGGLVLGLDQTVGRGAADGSVQAKDRQRWQRRGQKAAELLMRREQGSFLPPPPSKPHERSLPRLSEPCCLVRTTSAGCKGRR